MKRNLLLALTLMGSLCFGAANDTLITFSTQGPDTYGDGSPVLDGECYALMWTRNGSTFGGFKADGTLVSENDRLVVVAPLAKGARCPETLFEIDADYAKTLEDGSFALYLLDTRTRGADGSVVPGGVKRPASDQTGVAVNAAGRCGAGGAVSLAKVGVYAEVGEPKITAMRIEDATVVLKVEGMVDTVDYFVLQGTEPGKVETQLETTVAGDTLKVGKPEGESMCFRVVGARKFK